MTVEGRFSLDTNILVYAFSIEPASAACGPGSGRRGTERPVTRSMHVVRIERRAPLPAPPPGA